MTAILTPRRNGVTHRNEWPDMTGLAMSRSHRLFLRDDPLLRQRRAMDATLRRRRAVKLSRTPRLGFWQQPVGGVVTVVLFALFFAVMIACVLVVGSGQGGN